MLLFIFDNFKHFGNKMRIPVAFYKAEMTSFYVYFGYKQVKDVISTLIKKYQHKPLALLTYFFI